jgi:hypothetical protein
MCSFSLVSQPYSSHDVSSMSSGIRQEALEKLEHYLRARGFELRDERGRAVPMGQIALSGSIKWMDLRKARSFDPPLVPWLVE